MPQTSGSIGSGPRGGGLRVAAGAFLISFSGVWVKLTNVTPTVSAFYRVFFGVVILLVLMGVKREAFWRGGRRMAWAVFCGFWFALDLFAWHRSIVAVGPGLSTILANFQVFLMALYGAAVLGERLTLRQVGALPVAVGGLFLIVGIRWQDLGDIYRAGVWLGLATAVCYTAYLAGLRRLQQMPGGFSAMANLTLISGFAALFLAADTIHSGVGFSIPDGRSLAALICLGLFSQVVGWALITEGLPKIRASLAGLLLLLQPTLSFVWDILFFGREAGLSSLLGAALTLTAIYMGSTGRRKG